MNAWNLVKFVRVKYISQRKHSYKQLIPSFVSSKRKVDGISLSTSLFFRNDLLSQLTWGCIHGQVYTCRPSPHTESQNHTTPIILGGYRQMRCIDRTACLIHATGSQQLAITDNIVSTGWMHQGRAWAPASSGEGCSHHHGRAPPGVVQGSAPVCLITTIHDLTICFVLLQS